MTLQASVSLFRTSMQRFRRAAICGRKPGFHRTRRYILFYAQNAKPISGEIPTISRLLNAEEIRLDQQYQAQPGNPVAVTPLGEILLATAAADKAAEGERLDKEIARIEKELRTVEDKLRDKSFVERAPAAVVEEHRQRLRDFSAQLTKLKRAREGLN